MTRCVEDALQDVAADQAYERVEKYLLDQEFKALAIAGYFDDETARNRADAYRGAANKIKRWRDELAANGRI